MKSPHILMKILVVIIFTLLNVLGCSNNQQQFDDDFAQRQGQGQGQENYDEERVEDNERDQRPDQESNGLYDSS